MTPPIRVKVEWERNMEQFPGISMYLVEEETGRKIPNKEIMERFENLTIIGVGIIRKKGHNIYPHTAFITDIKDDVVVITDPIFKTQTFVDRDEFHDYYELD